MVTSLGYVVTAARSIRDEQSHRLTLIDVFDSFTLPKDTPESSQFFVTATRVLNVPVGEASVEIKIENPKGEIISEAKSTQFLVAGDLDVLTVFNAVKVADEGKYHIRVYFNGERLEDNNRFYVRLARR